MERRALIVSLLVPLAALGQDCPDAPDLKSELSISTTCDVITYVLTVTNDGGATSGEIPVDIYYDAPDGPAGHMVSKSSTVPAVEPGQTATLTVTWEYYLPDDGTMDPLVWLDPGPPHATDDCNRDDNQLSQSVVLATADCTCDRGRFAENTCHCNGFRMFGAYCCDSGPQVQPCDDETEAEPSPGEDTGASGDEDAGGPVPDAATGGGSGDSGGCIATGRAPSGAPWWLLVLALATLLGRRSAAG